MPLIAFATARWQLMSVMVLLAVLAGLYAVLNIPRAVDPHFPTPFVVTTVLVPGADALQVEETVTRPIEEGLQGLDHVRVIRSNSFKGLSTSVVEFEHGTDAEQSLDRVVRVVNSLRDRLPREISRINIFRSRTTEAAMLQIAIYSDGANARRLVKYAEDLRRRLNGVAGVRATRLFGAPGPEVRVRLNADRLAAAGIAPSEVVAALARGGAVVPVGAVSAGAMRYPVNAGGEYRSLAAIAATPLRAGPTGVSRIGDVAEIDWSEGEQLHLTRVDGTPAMFLTVLQKDGLDTIRLRDRLLGVLSDASAALPPDIRIAPVFDQSREVSAKLEQLGRDFLIALALVALTLFPIGWRAALIVMVAIPLSLAGGILVLWLFGYSLNQISIAGFIIALGLLVDDSIVVVEAIERRQRDGATGAAAVISGAGEVARPVIGATLVLLIAFLPLAALPDAAGDFVRGLPIAVLATVAVSLVVSLSVIPLLASIAFRRVENRRPARIDWLLRLIRRFYAPVLGRALDHPRRWVFGAMAASFAALALVPVLGFSLFPAADTGYFLVRVETPEGSSLARTERAVERASAVLATEPAIVHRLENVGAGNPQVFYNVARRDENANYGDVLAILSGWNPTSGPAMLERLRAKLARDPEARVSLLTFANGPSIEAPVAVRIAGENLDTLKALADRVERLMLRQPGLRDVRNPLGFEATTLDLRVDEEKAALFGVPVGEARRALRLAITGEEASRFRDEEGDSWPVMVRLTGPEPSVDDLGGLILAGRNNAPVPLAQVIRTELGSAPPVIARRGLQRVVTVTAYVGPGELTSRQTASLAAQLQRWRLPPGYRLSFGGEAESAERNFSGLSLSLVACLLGILTILLWEFGKFREAVAVLGVVPLGMLGGLVALFLTGNSLSFLAMIGFIALIGIEIKNSILLIDSAAQFRAGGLDPRAAVARAGETRFLPVLLTSVTAIGGLLPLALGKSALYSPIAWVIIGGLVTSTLLSRVVTPAMYLLILGRTATRRPETQAADSDGSRA